MKIQFFKRSDNTSFDYLGREIIKGVKSYGHEVNVKSVDKYIEGEKIDRADIAIVYGLISDIRWVLPYKLKIAGLVCERDLNHKEIKQIKEANLTEIWLPSEFVMAKFQQEGFINNLSLVPHGVSFIQKIKQKKIPTNKILMIFSSYKKLEFETERKGILEVLEAWDKYKIDKQLILRTQYRNYYSKYNLDNVVFIENKVDNLTDLFNKVDIVLCPSHSEGFGIVGLEALAAGISLISTKTGNDYLTEDLSYIEIDLPVTAEKIKKSIDTYYKNFNFYNIISLKQSDEVYEKYKWDNFYKVIQKRINILHNKR